jgi:integrase
LVDGYGKAKGLGKLEPKDIEGHQIQAILDALKKDQSHTPSAVRGVATRLWLWMKRRNWVKSKDASLDLDAPMPKPRDRKFNEDEIRLLLNGCSNHYRAIALNPLRIAEHCRIHWSLIDADNNATIKVKGGKQHIQPLTDDYLACSDQPRRSIGGDFFLNKRGLALTKDALSRIGTARAREVGVQNHHCHDWRQTFGVWAEKERIQFEFWDSCLSHEQQTGIRKVYGGYQYLEEKRETLEKWNDYLRQFWK